MKPWRVLFTGKRGGAFNMAVDAAVFKQVEAGESPPTLRLYGWEPYCVSLGYFQRPERELDARALRERGWDFVLRPTGGRAVLHAEELTYSLIARRSEAEWCGTLKDSFEAIGKAWSRALQGFGLELSPGQPSEKPHDAVALPCFASTSRSELAFGQRKVVGSAQRRAREAFLQHGSIPLTSQHERLVEVLRLPEDQKQAYLKALRQHAVSLGEIADLPGGDLERWFKSRAAIFLESLGVSWEIGTLSQEELAWTEKLEQRNKARQSGFLGSQELNFPNSPEFSLASH